MAGEGCPQSIRPTAAVKKAGTAWEHWTSQIDDHLKPPTVAKRCTFRESRKSPALRGFVAGRWALATTSLYPSTKIERPQRAQNRGPRRRSFSGTEWPRWSGLPRHDCPGQPPPHTRPNAIQVPPVGVLAPTSAPKPAYRAHTAATVAFLWASAPSRRVGAGHARKCARLPLAASQVLCLPYHAPA